MRAVPIYVHFVVCGFVLLSACVDRSAPAVDASQPPTEPEVDASQPPTEPEVDASQAPIDAGEDTDAAASVEALIGNACTFTTCPAGTRCQVIEGEVQCVPRGIVLLP